MLSRYGAPREVLTDRGGEFQAEFDDLLTKHEITHRLASRDHPQTDGLANMKRSLRKSLCDGGGLRWDELLPYVAMGYKMSTHKSLRYSPYSLLFGRDPIFQARHHPLVELEKEPSDEEMQVFLSTREQTFRRVMPLAMRNLAIAQLRQKERYNLVRGGEWAKPKASFAVGDYVMVMRKTENTLQASAHPHVLSIVELRASGVVILEGSDAPRCTKQMKDVAHCPLPILDTTLHPGRY